MSDAGEIEVENSALYEVLPKDVVKEVGNVKLFNKWDYDVEVRDISLTYVLTLKKLS
jgi:small subunit ribosomal protein S5e